MKPIWSGAISFGLVSVPVKIYSASQERALKFRLLEKNGYCPISYAKICRATNKEVPMEDIVKGYEYRKGDYVILTDEDFAKVAPRKSKTVEIEHFAREEDIEKKYVEKPYYLEPESGAQKAYALLRDALKGSGTVGIAKWVLKNKEHLAIVRPEGRALMLIQLRYAEEVNEPSGLSLPEAGEYSGEELEIALSLIRQMERPFEIRQYADAYAVELMKVIEHKAKGETIRAPEEGAAAAADMRNLMEMLRKSLEEEKKRSGR